jgi:hypothetical protein
MANGTEIISELMIALIIPPVLTGLWLLFAGINNRIVDKRGKGSRVDAHPVQQLIWFYFLAFILALIHVFGKRM